MKAEKQHTFVSANAANEIVKALIEEFQDQEFREGYTEDFVNAKIATQIKVLREQRKWSQEELAERSQMAQERVCVLEDIDYESWTLKVLRRFANAFGLVADFEFREYGEMLTEIQQFGRERLEKKGFEEDPVFQHETRQRFRNERSESNVVASVPIQQKLWLEEVPKKDTGRGTTVRQSNEGNTADFLKERKAA